ncbi:hypothetical protein D6C89_02189 [Aureobasidium pullulans]|uniref:Uncharacterized protein n=1 Tax=Aureobasidium pullulans TaxID=5580 RepID=A0A4S9TV00_AURPU|nr:hypothetical protein D6D20_05494 [Aureobasidium pullulans]THZ29200.1 hypothetical protein D6C89_02189 [Aureobasidium pullulans]TIA04726.1 hypothetical protein D6C82_00728 [Aureobasidium pullulans]
MSNHSDDSDRESVPATNQILPSVKPEQPVVNPYTISSKDMSIIYVAGQILSCLGLVYLDLFCPDTSSILAYLSEGACGFLHLVAYVIFAVINASTFGKYNTPRPPGDSASEEIRAGIGAMLGIAIAVLLAALTHALDEKGWIYQIFWLQLLAAPCTCLARSSSCFENMTEDKQTVAIQVAGHIMANLLLWFHLENKPVALENDLYPLIEPKWFGWGVAICCLLGVSIGLFFVVSGCIIEKHMSDNQRALFLIAFGSLGGMSVMWLMAKLFDYFVHTTILHKLPLIENGALPGAYFIGTSGWLLKALKTSPEYSAVNPAEPSVV